ncbi:hypothetical protein OAT11_07455 [Nitrospinaceae bacterium]|nr:hypothetical protein [Nitrospinaceae bacterium]
MIHDISPVKSVFDFILDSLAHLQPFGNANLETLATGLPNITTEYCCTGDIINDKKMVWLSKILSTGFFDKQRSIFICHLGFLRQRFVRV